MLFAASGLPQFDASTFPNVLFWLLVSFGTLYLLVLRSGIPGIQQVLNAREDRILSDRAQARELGEAAEKTRAEYEAQRSAAQAEAQAEIRSAQSEAAKEAAAQLDARPAITKTSGMAKLNWKRDPSALKSVLTSPRPW